MRWQPRKEKRKFISSYEDFVLLRYICGQGAPVKSPWCGSVILCICSEKEHQYDVEIRLVNLDHLWHSQDPFTVWSSAYELTDISRDDGSFELQWPYDLLNMYILSVALSDFLCKRLSVNSNFPIYDQYCDIPLISHPNEEGRWRNARVMSRLWRLCVVDLFANLRQTF